MDGQTLLREPLAWAAILLSGIFLILGGLFVFAPAPAAAFYGFNPHAPSGLFYVRAVGLRDLALAVYILSLTVAGQRRALAIIMFGTLIIPAGDILLLAMSGASSPVHYLLHGSSLLCFAGLVWWCSRPGPAR